MSCLLCERYWLGLLLRVGTGHGKPGSEVMKFTNFIFQAWEVMREWHAFWLAPEFLSELDF